jgi:hypothetical protein
MKLAGYLLGLFLVVCLGASSFASGPVPLQPTAAAVPGSDNPPAPLASAEIAIPGPLRSFLRMAGISQQTSPDEVLPLLAQMVTTRGYARGAPTEFLILDGQRVTALRAVLFQPPPSEPGVRLSPHPALPLSVILGLLLMAAEA